MTNQRASASYKKRDKVWFYYRVQCHRVLLSLFREISLILGLRINCKVNLVWILHVQVPILKGKLLFVQNLYIFEAI